MIFFTGCPLHCQFCQNRQISGSDGENYGITVSDSDMASIMLSLESIGAHSLNLVTGTHFIIPVMDWIKKRHPHTDIPNLKGTLMRHLVFPGELESTYDFLRYFAKHYKDSFFLSLMTQFVPPLGDVDFPKLTEDEYDSLVYLMEDLGIEDGFMQDQSDDDILWIPDFRKDVPFPEPFSDPDPVFLSIKHR